MKTKSIILLAMMIISPLCGICQYDTLLKPQFINLATLVVDFDSYQFEGGTFSYYKKCIDCSNDSLPFVVDFHAPGDFGGITFKIASTFDTIFNGSIMWMGAGKIYYPDSFYIGYPFTLTDSIAENGTTEYFDWDGSKISIEDTFLIPLADSAWESVNKIEISNIFSEKNYRKGIFLYAPSVGAFDPSLAKWIIFLYYNYYTNSMIEMKTLKKAVDLYPNPCSDIINIGISTDELISLKLNIIAFDGKIIRTFYGNNNSIDVSDLKPGAYMLRFSDGENSNTRLFIKERIIH
jgi:hypothetical protein